MNANFRVTQRSVALASQSNLSRSLSAVARLQEKLSSGREISRPSDSPGGTSSALTLRSSIKRHDQLERNANDGAGWLGEADTALQGASSVLQRARQLAISSNNAALDATAREAIALEVDGLRSQLLSLTNTSHLGRPLFSGTALPTAGNPDVAYDATGAYLGDNGTVTRTVAEGAGVQVNLTGPEVFGPAGSNAFTVLGDLAANIRAGSTTIASVDIAAIDVASTRILTGLAVVGARTNQLETLQARNAISKDSRLSSLNNIESIDLPKTITDLQLQDMAYQAALSATAKVIQPSLMDFLR